MEIESSELLYTPSDLHLEDNDEEAVEREDDEDIPVELSTLVVTEMDKVDLFTGYKSVGDEIVYNDESDETVEVKRSEEEENKIEKGEMEESEIDMGEIDQSKVEVSDHFEDFE